MFENSTLTLRQLYVWSHSPQTPGTALCRWPLRRARVQERAWKSLLARWPPAGTWDLRFREGPRHSRS